MHHILQSAFSALVQILVFLFFLGIFGCVFVVVISFWDDIKTILSHVQPEPRRVEKPYEF